ncbi:MAG TPA: phosphoglycerate mutase, partial [Gammaproteobacteria bacterium]|nr:phosphoglycerate mutase [Gammaproteobacteria bacterium]
MNTPQQKSALLIILDGMGDRPCSKLNGVTPLEYASLPEMDRLVEQGICGLAYPLAPGLPVDT